MKLLAISLLLLTACDFTPSADQHDQDTVQAQQKIYATGQPVPSFKWSQDRDNLIQIYTQKNEARMTTSVVRAITGEITWSCPSIGFPIPADTQLTNPLQIAWGSTTMGGNYHADVIEQAEPNGLFSSKATDATYVICVDDDGEASPQYTESKVDVFTRPVEIVNGHVSFLKGAPSMRIQRHP